MIIMFFFTSSGQSRKSAEVNIQTTGRCWTTTDVKTLLRRVAQLAPNIDAWMELRNTKYSLILLSKVDVRALSEQEIQQYGVVFNRFTHLYHDGRRERDVMTKTISTIDARTSVESD